MSTVCAICVYTDAGDARKTHVVMDGASLCLTHYAAVMNRSDYIYFDSGDRFRLRETVQHLMEGKETPQLSGLGD